MNADASGAAFGQTCALNATIAVGGSLSLLPRFDPGTALEIIVCVDSSNETTLSWQELIECEQEEFDLGAATAVVNPNDLLTFIYTLGTGGPSTLARLTHADVLARVMALGERLAEIRPEFFAPPPSLWERMRDSVLARFDGHLERAAADRAAALAGIGLDQLQSATVAHSCPPDLVGFWRTLGVPLNIEELCSE